eukprot:TRINITY_DN124819_c0_g1_i1.p1 TRINITY_DN124819_c0_g1~~TRINITY_DN124819_c0_g1_i1.p1  ORF type:complete len:246 (-),score=56.80 TRINITY_DN124819_c0_g1_i1:66-803(-)
MPPLATPLIQQRSPVSNPASRRGSKHVSPRSRPQGLLPTPRLQAQAGNRSRQVSKSRSGVSEAINQLLVEAQAIEDQGEELAKALQEEDGSSDDVGAVRRRVLRLLINADSTGLLAAEQALLANPPKEVESPAGSNASAAATPQAKGAKQEQILTVFQMFDFNKDGIIDRDEFRMVLQFLDCQQWDDKRVDRLIKAMDFNQDKGIQFDEFCAWLFDAEPSFQRERFVGALRNIPEAASIVQAVGL